MRFLKPYLLVLYFSIICSVTYSQKDSSLVIDKGTWEKASKGVDYTESYKEANEEEPTKDTNVNFTPLNYDWSSLKYVFYFIVVGVVIFLIIKILTNLNKNPNIKKQDISIESMEEIEEKIHEIDLNQLLKNAIDNRNFHIALRVNFLIIIKLLSEGGHIKWAKEKTNWEYHAEIKDIPLKDGLKTIIIAFEPIWYGEHNLTEEGFNLLEPVFNSFKKLINSNE